MYLTLALFSLGNLIVGQLPVLPGLSGLVWLALATVIALVRRRTRPLVGLIAGFAYVIYSGQSWLDHKVPYALEGTPLHVFGTVAEMPIKSENGWRIRLRVANGELEDRLLALGWYEPDPPSAGETWQLVIKLIRPRGTVNPGLFDYEAWLLSEGVHGTGYVLPAADKKRLSESRSHGVFERKRHQLINQVVNREAESAARSMLLALLVGDSSQMSNDTWEVLSGTGTNHLLIVSGLHVSLVIGLVFWLFNRCLGLSREPCVLIAICVAVVYAFMTGFGLPIQRALLMSSVGLLVVTARRQTSAWHALTLALASVLAMNPFAFLTAGFWLSFAAVTGLLFAFQGRRVSSAAMIPALFRSQWAALLITAPLLLCWIFKFSLASVLANLIAIPAVSILIVPALLFALFIWLLGVALISDWIIEVALVCLSILFSFLSALAGLDWMIHQPLDFGWSLALALLGSVLMLLPRISVPRWAGALCWLPMLNPIVPDVEGTRVDLLDVGQGLSVVIRTANRTLLYDTGPAFGRFDAGEQVVVPTLKKMGVEKLDLMVVSHGDNDHAGGAAAVQAEIAIEDSLIGPCLEYRLWEFDDLRAEVLLTEVALTDKRNDLSCVLLVETRDATILLPGDIESKAEQGLITNELRDFDLNPVDLLIAPHHGSLSSSNPAFINVVSPHWVVFSTGYQNRFGHPHSGVVRRYLNRGVRALNTADSGLISVHFQREGRVVIGEARQSHRRFWYDASSPFVGK